ncbi:hypothetical protein CEE69_12690 [Rhodopirellula bahusiensis]|uniref:Uncharacterized protein n=1 Tax=Rhodopirellula bahusiensis TaxID=2014065 RepID=A0A2G1W6U9_9BACT|nr:hypothetical protein CEE69_12690 [Rhodopirellula bahusiensis]
MALPVQTTEASWLLMFVQATGSTRKSLDRLNSWQAIEPISFQLAIRCGPERRMGWSLPARLARLNRPFATSDCYRS